MRDRSEDGRCTAAVTAEDAGWLAAHLKAMIMTGPGAWAGSEMTLTQIMALHYICAKEPVSLTSLAEALETGPPATCAMVDRLVHAGLITRIHDPTDRRRIRLMVTDTAGPMLGGIDLDTARHLHAVLNGMTTAARRRLTDTLRDTAQQLAGHQR